MLRRSRFVQMSFFYCLIDFTSLDTFCIAQLSSVCSDIDVKVGAGKWRPASNGPW